MLINRLTNTALTPFQALSRELDRMFEGLVDAPTNGGAFPAIAISEDEAAFHLEVEVPGVRAEDLDISVTGNRVTLKGERKEPSRDKATVHRREWGAFQFERSFELPVDVDGEHIDASLEAGMLHVTLPKAAQHKPVKVKITAKD